MTSSPRPDIAAAPRVVVKVGSSSLTTSAGEIADEAITALAAALAARRAAGIQVVLVSSGAIASGLVPLGLTRRPSDLATQQAAASVGQGLLIARYTAAFAQHGIRTGQVLLSADDVLGEGRGVPGDEQALANAGRGLLGGQVAGAPGQAQRDQAGRDCPGGDQHNLDADAAAGGQGGDQRRDRLVGDLAGLGGERGGADLDHHPGGGGDVCPYWAHGESLGSVPRGPWRGLDPLLIGAAGSQSKTTASSGSPISTSAPGSAPASASASSTPSRASRSAR